MNARPHHSGSHWKAISLCCILLAGCGRHVSNAGDADRLEKVFGLTSSSPNAGDPSGFKNADTPALAKTVADALRSGDMNTVALALHTLNFRGSGLSFDQYDAIRTTYNDVSEELSQKAAKGDQQANDLLNKLRP